MYYNLYYIKDKKEIKEMDNSIKELEEDLATFADIQKKFDNVFNIADLNKIFNEKEMALLMTSVQIAKDYVTDLIRKEKKNG